MKNIILFVGLLTALFVAGCKLKEGNYLPELKIKIPVGLAENIEVREFLQSNVSMLNEFSESFEELVIACSPLVEKEENQLQASEKEKLGSYMMNFTEMLGMFAVKTAEMEANYTAVEYILEEEQLPVFNEIMQTLNDRVIVINERYSNFGIPESELINQ